MSPPPAGAADAPTHSSFLPAFMRPRRAAVIASDPGVIAERFAFYRPRIIIWSTLGYGIFYFVRKNLSVAQPFIEQELHITKTNLGLFLTLNGVLYGISKFLNGILADRADARMFMAVALAISAALNLCFGFSSTIVWMGIFWMLNGWFQGMGYPPCARVLTHWFSPREIATRMSWWNSSHCLGSSGILILAAYLVTTTGNWRYCFWVPAAIAIVTAGLLLLNLRDTPESVGLPEIAGSHVEEQENASEPHGAFLMRRVFSNRYIWLFSIGNFFVYTLRYSVFDWGPTMLREAKGLTIVNASWMIVGFEVAGLAGMLLTGWMTDRVFRGRCAPLCTFSMIMCAFVTYLFWKTPAHMAWANTGLLAILGFFVYIPQALVAVAVVNLATKHAAATAVGLTSIFGYASTVLSGWGLGTLVQHHGWSNAFPWLIGIAVVGAGIFAAALPSKPFGYSDQPAELKDADAL